MKLTLLSQKNKKQFKKLYKEAFPINERKPFSLIIIAYKLRKTQILSIEKNNKFVGFFILAKSEDLIFIDYFAISESERNNGLGSEALAILKKSYPNKRIFLEVENPINNTDNFQQRIRRIKFYEKNEFVLQNIRVELSKNDFLLMSYNGIVSFEEYVKVMKRSYSSLYTIMISKPKLITDNN